MSVLGPGKTGVLVRLNASPRNCRLNFSVRWKRFCKARSRLGTYGLRIHPTRSGKTRRAHFGRGPPPDGLFFYHRPEGGGGVTKLGNVKDASGRVLREAATP